MDIAFLKHSVYRCNSLSRMTDTQVTVQFS